MNPTARHERGWFPARLPDDLAAQPLTGAAWTVYLQGQGYTTTEIAWLRLAGELARRMRAAATKPPAVDAPTREAMVEGAALEYLADNPPALVEAVKVGPVQVLTPEELGQRLIAPAIDPGQARVDVLTGERWTVRQLAGVGHAGQAVIAGVLYRALGVAAPEARVVDLPGARLLAHPELREWARWTPSELAAGRGEELARELAADAWLGMLRQVGDDVVPWGVLTRAQRIDGTAALVRADLAGALEWVDARTPKAVFGAAVPELALALASPMYATARAQPGLVREGMDALLALSADVLEAAITPGLLTEEEGARLLGVLTARRSVMAAFVKR